MSRLCPSRTLSNHKPPFLSKATPKKKLKRRATLNDRSNALLIHQRQKLPSTVQIATWYILLSNDDEPKLLAHRTTKVTPRKEGRPAHHEICNPMQCESHRRPIRAVCRNPRDRQTLCKQVAVCSAKTIAGNAVVPTKLLHVMLVVCDKGKNGYLQK